MNKYGMFQIQNSGVLGPGITDLLQRQTDQYAGSTRPKAYLNWVLLDEQFKIVNSSSGFEQVGGDDQLTAIVKTGLPISQNGYLYVYTSNESPVDVFFDNLQVTHVRGPLLEETHYYPFGLTMAGISSKAAGKLENKYKFNGNKLESGEFSDGSGLEMYDFNARTYDQQIGRFMQIDPEVEDGQESWTPYHFGFNNPILNDDPDGKNPIKGLLKLGSIVMRVIRAKEKLSEIKNIKLDDVIKEFGWFKFDEASLAKSQASLKAAIDASKEKASGEEGEKKVPNPDGAKGKPDHQEKVKELTDKARGEAKEGETVVSEKKIQGHDSKRRPDVQIVDKDGKTRKVFEAERKPNSQRNIKREAEYKKLQVEQETHKVGGAKPNP